MCIRKSWKHESGSSIYETVDGRGKIVVRFIGFRIQYDAYLDNKLIGTRNQRGQAMTYIENAIIDNPKQETGKC